MHAESMQLAKWFRDKYMNAAVPLKVLDVGSRDINGNLRELFMNEEWEYRGLDVQDGKNVDIIVREEVPWGIDEEYDVVVSANCIEHVSLLGWWMVNIRNALKSGGFVFITSPFIMGLHSRPDYWRVTQDGIKVLMEKWGGLTVIEVGHSSTDRQDVWGVGQKI